MTQPQATAEDRLRAKLQALLTSRATCPACARRLTIADISRATSIDYSSLHKFLRGKKNRHLFPAGIERLEDWLGKYRLVRR